MAFRCGLNGTAGLPHFECFMGSTCSWDSLHQVQYCACPDGWTGDTVGFGHFPNCTLHREFLFGFFVAYTIIFWPLFLSFVQKARLSTVQGRVRKVVRVCALWSLLSYIHCLCVFIEQGLFEASLVTFGAVTVVGFILAYHCNLLLLEPMLARAGLGDVARNIQPLTAGITLLSNAVTVALVGAMLRYCRESDLTVYNSLMLSMLLCVITLLVIFVGSISFASYRIRQLMPSEAVTMNTQLCSILGFSLMTLTVGSGTLGFLLVWAVYSSFPFMYVQWALCQCLILVLLVAIRPLLKSGKRTGETTRKSSSHRHEGSGEGLGSAGNDDGPLMYSIRGLGIRRGKQGTKTVKAMTRITEIEESEKHGSSKAASQNESMVYISEESVRPAVNSSS